jgi:hypothetical protein
MGVVENGILAEQMVSIIGSLLAQFVEYRHAMRNYFIYATLVLQYR